MDVIFQCCMANEHLVFQVIDIDGRIGKTQLESKIADAVLPAEKCSVDTVQFTDLVRILSSKEVPFAPDGIDFCVKGF